MMEASLPASMRWLPKSMSVQYLKTCKTDLIAECTTSDLAEDLFRSAPPAGDAEKLRAFAVLFVQRHRQAIDDLIGRLAEEINLDSSTNTSFHKTTSLFQLNALRLILQAHQIPKPGFLTHGIDEHF